MNNLKLTNDDFDQLVTKAWTISKKEFSEMLRCLDDIYYNNIVATTVFPDAYYDILKDIYEKKSPDGRGFGKWKSIGAPIGKDEVKLPYYLGSMDKITVSDSDNVKKIKKFLENYFGPYFAEDKLDGVSGLLIYQEGELPKLYTRGDGHKGLNISKLIKYLKFPKIDLEKGDILAIRGEIIMSKTNFIKLNNGLTEAQQYKNARNLASGIVNSKNMTVVREKAANLLDFVTYEILDPRIYTPLEQLKQLKKLGFKVAQYKEKVKKPLTVDGLEKLTKEMKAKSPYEIDGIIIYDTSEIYSVNKSGNPDYAFAFKIPTETAIVNVEEVIWKISKHGQIKPRIKINPSVNLGGVDITYVTAHNAKKVNDDGLGPGAQIEITRSGDVIPYIVRTVKGVNPQMPDIPYEWNETHVDIIYTGDEDEDIKIRQITEFFKTLKIKGISDKTIEKLYDGGYHSVKDILDASKKDLVAAGFGEKQSGNIYNAIQKGIKNVDLAVLMAASTIFGQGFGKRKAQFILNVYPDILEYQANNKLLEKIIEIEGFAENTATQFVENLDTFRNFIGEIPQVTFKTKEVITKGKLSGQKITFTGFRDKNLETNVEKLGGTIASSVSKRTFILVASDPESTSGKVKKARKDNVRIMSKEEFENYIK